MKINGVTRELAEEMGKYIYGFIETDHPVSFGAIGMGDHAEVSTICTSDIAAVVSDHPVMEFDRLNKEQLTELVRVHQQVIERVSLSQTMIPFKFGSISEDDEAVRSVLEKAYIQFKALFNRVREKIELVVQVSADKQSWIKNIADTNTRIKELLSQPDKLTAAEKQFAQIEAGKIIHALISKKEKVFIDDILSTLRNGGHFYAPGRLLNQEMIFNGSFLIDKKSETEFDRKVNELADKYKNDLSFKYIGPMPPVSFINLKLEISDFKLIDNARKLLGLPEKATMLEIKTAYRDLANKYHPDKTKDDARAEGKFSDIADAYHILDTYCRNYRYSFSEEIITDTVLVHAEECNNFM